LVFHSSTITMMHGPINISHSWGLRNQKVTNQSGVSYEFKWIPRSLFPLRELNRLWCDAVCCQACSSRCFGEADVPPSSGSKRPK